MMTRARTGPDSLSVKAVLVTTWLVTMIVASAVLSVLPASASGGTSGGGGDEVVKRGSCSGPATWKLKAKPDNGRIEVEGEVDSNWSGQIWRWRIRHNGDVSARGKATTHGTSASFSVTRWLVNAAGTDTIGWRARNVTSGQVCRGSLRF